MKGQMIKLGKTLVMGFKNHSPAILTGLGVAGLVTTVVYAISVTPTAVEIVKEEKEKKKEGEKFGPIDYVKATWKVYLPVGLMMVTTAGCIIGANSVALRRNASLASLYALSEANLSDLKEQMAKEVGVNKARKIEEDASAKKVEKNPPDPAKIIVTGKGDYLFLDSFSGRYFRSDVETVRGIANDIRERIVTDMSVCLNELYYELGLSEIRIANDVGWNSDHPLKVSFATTLTDQNEPCIVLDYEVEPYYNYLNY